MSERYVSGAIMKEVSVFQPTRTFHQQRERKQMSRIMSYNSNQSYHLYYVMSYEYPVKIVEVSRCLIKIYNQVAICKKKLSSLT